MSWYIFVILIHCSLCIQRYVVLCFRRLNIINLSFLKRVYFRCRRFQFWIVDISRSLPSVCFNKQTAVAICVFSYVTPTIMCRLVVNVNKKTRQRYNILIICYRHRPRWRAFVVIYFWGRVVSPASYFWSATDNNNIIRFWR